MAAFFTNFECENALKWNKLVDTLEGGMSRFSTGGVIQPVRAMLAVPEHNGYLGMMPCYSAFENVLSCKMLCLYSDNKKYDAPTIVVYVLLFDADNGKLISIMEGENITKRRTAATSALSARFLSQSTPPRKLAILGSGLQALSHIQVLVNTFPSIEEISIWNYRKASATALAEKVSGWLPGKTLKVCDDVPQCVDDADLIVTVTFASQPVLMSANVKLGAHIMAVGACTPDMAELEPALMQNAQVFVDSYGGARKESGDILQSGCEIKAELGQVIAGQKDGRQGDEAVTVYKSLGLAVQDLVAAKIVYDSANGQGTSQLPFTIFSDDDVTRSASDLWFADEDVVPADSVATGLTAREVTMECRASKHGSNYLTCTLRTGTKDGSERSDLCMVYKALTGQLLGFIQGGTFNKFTEDCKQSLLRRLFPL